MVFGAILAAVAAAGLIASARRAHARLREALDRAAAAERELATLSRDQVQAQLGLDFLSRFVREFPHMTRDMHTTQGQRDIARLVLNLVTRTFQPSRALVLRRHLHLGEEGQSVSRYVVAAATSDSPLQPGSEVPELGPDLELAVCGHGVACRREHGGAPASARPGLEFDLAAPIVFGEETLGLIALSNPVRAGEDAKAALRLIAQSGAQALHSAAAYRRVQNTANLDGLTGVFNKRHMTQVLAEMVIATGRTQGALSVFMFDVDHFKHFNDAHGHVEGDHLLKELARLVRNHIRQEDVFGRFGGEEFLLILPRTPLAAALGVADKLRARIADHKFPHSDRQPLGLLSVSGGVAEFPGDALDSSHLLRAADEALYAAKRGGRNRVLAAERRELGGPPLEPGGQPSRT
jgi:diguanylate cyclase (GGDEF)-like protein